MKRIAALTLCLLARLAEVEAAKPNVLFIVIDDMNDWISLLDPQSPIKTPNLERLAKRGAELIDPIRETPFERFFFRDPNGYIFEVVDADHAPEI